MLKSKLGYLMLDHQIKSVSALAEKIDLSRETLRKIYNGTKLETLNLETIVKLCQFFNCEIQDIIQYIPDEKTENPTAD